MWKRRTGRGRKAAAPRIWPQVLLWTLLVVETLWLAAFMVSNGSPLPSVAERWTRQPGAGAPAWTAAEERRLDASQSQTDDLMVRKLLSEKGSVGSGKPPVPAPPEK